jgi:YggT family protein|tara:strand:+ start:2022 stop:2393 length:372 start_codon:yes stop_codon:yes gene_type:complete
LKGLRRAAASCSLVALCLPADKEMKGLFMTSIFQILMLLLNIVWFIIIAHVIMSWLINFQVLNLRQPLVAQIWDGLNRLLEPVYSRVRRFLPQMGGLDLAPLVVLISVAILRILLVNNAAMFY